LAVSEGMSKCGDDGAKRSSESFVAIRNQDRGEAHEPPRKSTRTYRSSSIVMEKAQKMRDPGASLYDLGKAGQPQKKSPGSWSRARFRNQQQNNTSPSSAQFMRRSATARPGGTTSHGLCAIESVGRQPTATTKKKTRCRGAQALKSTSHGHGREKHCPGSLILD